MKKLKRLCSTLSRLLRRIKESLPKKQSLVEKPIAPTFQEDLKKEIVSARKKRAHARQEIMKSKRRIFEAQVKFKKSVARQKMLKQEKRELKETMVTEKALLFKLGKVLASEKSALPTFIHELEKDSLSTLINASTHVVRLTRAAGAHEVFIEHMNHVMKTQPDRLQENWECAKFNSRQLH